MSHAFVNKQMKNWWCGEKSTVELRSKVLAFGKTQINLVILSLNRIFAP